MKLTGLIVGLLMMSSLTQAQTTMFVTAQVREQLGLAQGFYEQGKYQQGIDVVVKLLKQPRVNLYEQALALQMQGYLYAGANQLDEAIRAFGKSLSTHALDKNVSLTLQYNLAQLLLSKEDYRQALVQLESWLSEVDSVSAEQHVVVAIAYYFAKQLDVARTHIDSALAAGGSPQKHWVELALAIYLETNKTTDAIKLLSRSLKAFPEDANMWRQLANLYRQNHENEKAGAALSLAHSANLLNEPDILNLARLFFYMDAPYKCADLLNDALQHGVIERKEDTLTMVAECWLSARESGRAAKAFADAAQLSNNGKWFVRQAEVLIESEQWSDAVVALTNAIATENISDESQAWLLLGIAYTELSDSKNAWVAFTHATKSERYKHQASQWLKHLRERNNTL